VSTASSSGPRVSHLVLNVRDIEASHRFYTEVLGFQQCGAMGPGSRIGIMRFYRGAPETHHDLALVQTKEESVDPETWSILATRVGVNHIAISYPSREEFLARIKHVQDIGVEFLQRGNHGMTHSAYIQDPDGNGIEVLYDLPAEVWEGDVNAALNYFEFLPTTGEDSLQDSDDYVRFTATASN
jgi:catechol-2,3-dioxygenase